MQVATLYLSFETRMSAVIVLRINLLDPAILDVRTFSQPHPCIWT